MMSENSSTGFIGQLKSGGMWLLGALATCGFHGVSASPSTRRCSGFRPIRLAEGMFDEVVSDGI